MVEDRSEDGWKEEEEEEEEYQVPINADDVINELDDLLEVGEGAVVDFGGCWRGEDVVVVDFGGVIGGLWGILVR